MGKEQRRQKHLAEGWKSIEGNDPRRAEALAKVSLEKSPEDAEFLRLLGTALLIQGRCQEALSPLQSAFGRVLGKGVGYHLGHCHLALGDAASAIAVLGREVDAFPDFAEARNLLGVALAKMARYEDARSAFATAIERNPRFAEAYNNMGNALLKLGRYDEAIPQFIKAIDLRKGFLPAYTNLGLAYQATHRHAEARDSYQSAIGIDPGCAEAHAGLGDACHELGNLEQAISCRLKAISLEPVFARAHLALGVSYHELKRMDEAVACYRRALELEPDSPESHYYLGTGLRDQGRQAEALACFRKALTLDPEYLAARWLLAMSQIPVVPGPDDDPARWRNEFSRELNELDLWIDPARAADAFGAVGASTPFYLAYREESNRDLLARHGALCARVMDAWRAREGIAASAAGSAEPIRVGVVSRHFESHSVWHALVKGWFGHLDRGRFSLHAFHLGFADDAETRFARAHAARFTQGARPLRQWVDAILDERPQVLIYPEIGMDALTLKLASLRLAPVQVASWGHPETTGLPTIDCYLSAEALEPADAQRNYTERLIALPNLGCFYTPPQMTAVPPDLAGLGIDPESTMLLCPGVAFKYPPEHDRVFPEIARRLGRCRFVFFTHQTADLSDKLRQRLATAFADVQMQASSFVTFVPWQEWAKFHGLLARAELVLDTIGFSGFNTAMQVVQCGAPMVAWEGRFMRGRFAAAILKRIGLGELVAGSVEDYIALAVKLAGDAAYRRRVRERIEASRALLYGDAAPIRALEDFLVKALASA